MKNWLSEIKSRFGAWWPTVEPAAAIAAILAVLMVSGCGAQMFACTTDAAYTVTNDGQLSASYKSCKEQQGFHAKIDQKSKVLDVSVDHAATQESVIAAALQSNAAALQLLGSALQQILPIITKAAETAAVSGS